MLSRYACLFVCSALACSPPTDKPAAATAPAAGCDSVTGTTNDLTPQAFVLAGSDFVRQARAKSTPDLYRNAEACVREALAREPNDAAALRLQGLVLLNDHRFEAARDLAKRVLARDEGDAMMWGTLSDAYLELGDLPGAMNAAQRMLDLKPNLPSYGRAAHLRWLQGDLAAAKRFYELAIASGRGQKDPEPRAWMIAQAAWLFWHEGDYPGAAAGFELALRLVPEYAPALEGLGRVALSAGDYAAAVRWLERAHDARPLVETAWALGDAYALLGDQSRSKQYYAEVERDGRKHDARALALYLAARDREHATALQLARAEYAQRKDVYTKDVLAFALYRDGQLREATALAQQVLATGTPDARLQYRAGVIRSAAARDAEEKAAAQKVISTALRRNPGLDPVLTGGHDATALANVR